jgi:hypothetical protein
VFEQMVMQRPTETIARNVELTIEETEQAQERVTHALMANGNLHLILRNPEGAIDDAFTQSDASTAPRILPMQQAMESIWDKMCVLIGDLPEPQKILLDMVFDKELDAKSILDQCQQMNLDLPVQPRSGQVTIHTIYQSVDAILKILATELEERFPQVLEDARNWLDDDQIGANASVTVKGLKALLKNMGIKPPPHATQGARHAANSG